MKLSNCSKNVKNYTVILLKKLFAHQSKLRGKDRLRGKKEFAVRLWNGKLIAICNKLRIDSKIITKITR